MAEMAIFRHILAQKTLKIAAQPEILLYMNSNWVHWFQRKFLPFLYLKNQILKFSDFGRQKPIFFHFVQKSKILKSQKNHKKIAKKFSNFVIFRHILVRKHFDPPLFFRFFIFSILLKMASQRPN